MTERRQRQHRADETQQRLAQPHRRAVVGFDAQIPREHADRLAAPDPEVGEEAEQFDEQNRLHERTDVRRRCESRRR